MKTDYSTSTVTVAELQSHTLTGVVQHEIEKMILRGELVPGQRLNEKLVADKLSVSRGPVREACRALAELGLVYLIPNRGVFIKRLTKSDAIEVYDLRAGLIGLSASLLAPILSTQSAAKLASDRMRSLLSPAVNSNCAADSRPIELRATAPAPVTKVCPIVS